MGEYLHMSNEPDKTQKPQDTWVRRRRITHQAWYASVAFPLIGVYNTELAIGLAPFFYALTGSIITIGYFGGSSYEAAKGVKND